MTEDLNIHNNIRELVLKALNKFEKIKDAASALGVSKRQLTRWRRQWDICRIGNGAFYFKQPARMYQVDQKKTA